jgi:hypothetical protein
MRKLSAVVFLGLFLSLVFARDQLTVAFNTKSLKYHYTSCSAAIRCTRSCIDVPLSEAIEAGGVPCKLCKPPRR